MSALDRNLARLLRECYAPALPPRELRERVLAHLETELAAAHAAPAARPQPLRAVASRHRARVALYTAAAAALLLALGAWWWFAGARDDAARGGRATDAPLVEHRPAADRAAHDARATRERDADLAHVDGERDANASDRRAAPVEVAPPLVPLDDASASIVGLAGRVVRASDGAPVPAFEIIAWELLDLPRIGEPERHEFSSEAGAFALPAARAGRHHLVVRADGLASQVLDGVRVPLDAPLRIALAAPTAVRGRVLDAQQRPLAGALVLCEALAPSPALPVRPEELPTELWGGTRTAADGTFELSDVPPGMRRVIALCSGHAPRSSASFELVAGAAQQLGDLVLGHGGSIAGRVEHGDGAPWPNVRVLASSMNFDGAPLLFDLDEADAQGRYRIEHLPAGPYVVMHFGDVARRAAAPEALLPARVREGETTALDFVDPRALLTLTGRVTQPDGTPAANYSLTLGLAQDQGETWKGATTDADGVYAFRGLEPGTWELHGGRNMALAMTRIAVVELAGRGEVVRDIALASGALRGRVVAAGDGRPLAKAILLVMSENAAGEPTDFRGKCAADSDGRFELAPLPGGRYLVWAIDDHGALATLRSDWLQLAEGQSLELADLALVPGGSAELAAREPDGAAVAGATLVFAPLGASEVPIALGPRTDDRGAFTARGLAPGTWTVRATHPDGRVAQTEFRVDPSRATRVELEFRAR